MVLELHVTRGEERALGAPTGGEELPWGGAGQSWGGEVPAKASAGSPIRKQGLGRGRERGLPNGRSPAF